MWRYRCALLYLWGKKVWEKENFTGASSNRTFSKVELYDPGSTRLVGNLCFDKMTQARFSTCTTPPVVFVASFYWQLEDDLLHCEGQRWHDVLSWCFLISLLLWVLKNNCDPECWTWSGWIQHPALQVAQIKPTSYIMGLHPIHRVVFQHVHLDWNCCLRKHTCTSKRIHEGGDSLICVCIHVCPYVWLYVFCVCVCVCVCVCACACVGHVMCTQFLCLLARNHFLIVNEVANNENVSLSFW